VIAIDACAPAELAAVAPSTVAVAMRRRNATTWLRQGRLSGRIVVESGAVTCAWRIVAGRSVRTVQAR
jgi:hypothetical protein